MEKNENYEMPSSHEEDIQNQDQTSQRRETDRQNDSIARQNSNMHNDLNDRGISSISPNGYMNNLNRENGEADRKKDSMNLDKENMVR
ncbi:MAG: hypothetical protein H7Y03_08495 [Chitinophagaceae bacterium]|nr:hypothetical protein [Chitinophagaceae bacterium]